MNKKVFVSMLVLSIVFLVGMYILKIFFPQEFMMSIQNDKIITIGTFIDTYKWAYYLCCSITSFLTYWLYLCATCNRRYLKLWQCVVVLLVIFGSFLLNEYSPTIALFYGICAMIILPYWFGASLKNVAIIYPMHILAQVLSIEIRGLPNLFSTYNSLFGIIMTLECYFWLLL